MSPVNSDLQLGALRLLTNLSVTDKHQHLLKGSITLLLSLVVVSNEALQVSIFSGCTWLIFFIFFQIQLLKAIKVLLKQLFNNYYNVLIHLKSCSSCWNTDKAEGAVNAV